MKAWRLGGDEDEGGSQTLLTQPAASKSVKRVFFADDDDMELVAASPSSSVGDTSATWRKKVGWGSELVIDDDPDDQERQADATDRGVDKCAEPHKEASSDCPVTTTTSLRSSKVNETATANVVESVVRPTATLRVAAGEVASASCDADANMKAFVHHLVRSHLLHHGQNDVVALLDVEKPCSALSTSVLQCLQQQVILSGSTGSEVTESTLELFLLSERSRSSSSSKFSSSRRSSKEITKAGAAEKTRESSKSKSSSSSSRRKKPVLNVVTSDDNANESKTAAEDEGYNRLNHPGSTPRASTDPTAAIMGEPGSTPMARAKDLAALGFDDLDDVQPAPPQPSALELPGAQCGSGGGNLDASPSSLELSQYALAKRAANKHNKHVRLGEPGSTPTKEYVFFRETPPRFVTESVEDAVEVFAALGNDPTFRAPVLDKFVELQSSDVGKYRVGQRVEGLGAQRNVSGVVIKVFGSRQCGSSGPGTIVIDTSPEEEEEPSGGGEAVEGS